MLDNITRYLEGITEAKSRRHLQYIAEPIGDRMSSQALVTAGLVISATKPKAKTGASTSYYCVNGVLVSIAAGTDMAALTGPTYATTLINVFCFFVDSAGNKTSAGGTAATTLAGVKWPQFPKNKALIGFIIATASGDFVPGGTDLDTGTTVYVSPIGAFDPTILTG
tara:strand:+ start:3689 stop:4189 length:501 start_codon:yes stop_codon:yes gene_type:complete